MRHNAFHNCSKLDFVDLSACSKLEKIKAGTFNHCYNLKIVHLPCALKTIEHDSFAACYSLKSIRLPSSLENLRNNAFVFCKELETVENFEHTKVKQIDDSAFDSCVKLKNIVLPGGIEKIGPHAFWGCVALDEMKFPQSVKEIGFLAFLNCGFKKIELPEKMNSLGSCFSRCEKLEYVKLPAECALLSDRAFDGSGKNGLPLVFEVPESSEVIDIGFLKNSFGNITLKINSMNQQLYLNPRKFELVPGASLVIEADKDANVKFLSMASKSKDITWDIEDKKHAVRKLYTINYTEKEKTKTKMDVEKAIETAYEELKRRKSSFETDKTVPVEEHTERE